MDTNTVQAMTASLIADDARKLVYDIASTFSWSEFLTAVVGVYLTAKGLRNRTSLGTSKLAPLLNAINLEVKGSQPEEVSKQQETKQV